MLNLDSALRLPAHVSFSIVGEDAFLLNTRTNKYFRLEKVGVRFWELLKAGQSIRAAHQVLLGEYAVEAVQLEQDLLELAADLLEQGLVESV